MHAQIVLCPGLHDGPTLEQTARALGLGERTGIDLPAEARPEQWLTELTAAGAKLVALTPIRETLEDLFVRRVSEMGEGARAESTTRPPRRRVQRSASL